MRFIRLENGKRDTIRCKSSLQLYIQVVTQWVMETIFNWPKQKGQLVLEKTITSLARINSLIFASTAPPSTSSVRSEVSKVCFAIWWVYQPKKSHYAYLNQSVSLPFRTRKGNTTTSQVLRTFLKSFVFVWKIFWSFRKLELLPNHKSSWFSGFRDFVTPLRFDFLLTVQGNQNFKYSSERKHESHGLNRKSERYNNIVI